MLITPFNSKVFSCLLKTAHKDYYYERHICHGACDEVLAVGYWPANLCTRTPQILECEEDKETFALTAKWFTHDFIAFVGRLIQHIGLGLPTRANVLAPPQSGMNRAAKSEFNFAHAKRLNVSPCALYSVSVVIQGIFLIANSHLF